MRLKPLPGYALVEIYEGKVAVTAQKYDTKTRGVCRDWLAPMGPQDPVDTARYNTIYASLTGKLVFWQDYKEGSTIESDGKKYTFVKIEDLMGYEDV